MRVITQADIDRFADLTGDHQWIHVDTEQAAQGPFGSTIAHGLLTLSLGPEPHPYRRIRQLGNGMQLAVKEWRIRFTVTERNVRVLEIGSGFRDSQIAAADSDERLRPHREFLALWPREPKV